MAAWAARPGSRTTHSRKGLGRGCGSGRSAGAIARAAMARGAPADDDLPNILRHLDEPGMNDGPIHAPLRWYSDDASFQPYEIFLK